MAIAIAGERSGAGKTTITLTLLAALSQRGERVQSFKVGPDYIDPMFHQAVTGRPCRNLDPVITSESYVQACFAQHCADADYGVVEGVMGLFDGARGEDDFASTAHIARLLEIPVVLVLDCSRMSRSVAAIAHGYRTFDPRVQIAGVVLNRIGSDRHLELLRAALEPLNLSILGVLRRQDHITLRDRHLGLVPTDELPEFSALIPQLAALGETCFDWPQLLPLLKTQPSVSSLSVPLFKGGWGDLSEASPISKPKPIQIAVARDRAFSFYYPDNLEILTQLGAELIFWSPLSDELPDGIHGLYFGGGFPEVFAEALSTNHTALKAVQAAIESGLPTYAECGGLMYLCQTIADFAGETWPMVGVLPTVAKMGDRLSLGYRQAIALHTTPLVTAGQTLFGHEFHRSHLDPPPNDPLFQLHRFDAGEFLCTEGWHRPNLHASYLHLHFGAQPEIPMRFLQACAQISSPDPGPPATVQ